jgi:xylulokinase
MAKSFTTAVSEGCESHQIKRKWLDYDRQPIHPRAGTRRQVTAPSVTLVAGVDSSTKSTKVVIVDVDDGRVVASASARHPATTPPLSEQDPWSWWRALEKAWKGCGPLTESVAAISIAGQQHGLVALDGNGEPVHPAKLWNDSESAPQTQALTDLLGPDEWARRCGSVLTPSFTITKLAWLRENHPDQFATIRRVLLPHEWLTWQLLGRPDVAIGDRGDASGTGWWSPAAGEVDEGLLSLVGGDVEWLPTILGPRDVAGSAQLLRPGALVAPGTGDNMGAALALGLAPGDIAISLGTSGTVFASSLLSTRDVLGEVAGFADAAGRNLPLVCTLNATKVTDWAVNLAGGHSTDLDRIGASSPPGANGVTLVPYLDGERTPLLPGASGSLFGIRTTTTGADIVRASVEGVICGLLAGVDALERCGVDTSGRVLAVGGGARSALYRQVLADLSNRDVITLDPAIDRVAVGAAAQAAAVLTQASPDSIGAAWASADPVVVTNKPTINPAHATELRDRYRSLAKSQAE